MTKYAFVFSGLILAATAAHARSAEQPAGHADHAATSAEATAPADAAVAPAQPAAPALTAGDVTEAEVDSFAKATVKLQAIQADTSLADDAKRTAMVAAVNEAGLEPAKYNAIGRAARTDEELRTRLQTAMAKYAEPNAG